MSPESWDTTQRSQQEEDQELMTGKPRRQWARRLLDGLFIWSVVLYGHFNINIYSLLYGYCDQLNIQNHQLETVLQILFLGHIGLQFFCSSFFKSYKNKNFIHKQSKSVRNA